MLLIHPLNRYPLSPPGNTANCCAPWKTTPSPLTAALLRHLNMARPSPPRGWLCKVSVCYILWLCVCVCVCVCVCHGRMWWEEGSQEDTCCLLLTLFVCFVFLQCYVQTEWARWRRRTMTSMLSHVCWRRWDGLFTSGLSEKQQTIIIAM